MSSIAKDGDVVEVNGTAFTGVKDSQYFGGFLSADGTVRKRINCTGLKWRESTGKKSTSLWPNVLKSSEMEDLSQCCEICSDVRKWMLAAVENALTDSEYCWDAHDQMGMWADVQYGHVIRRPSMAPPARRWRCRLLVRVLESMERDERCHFERHEWCRIIRWHSGSYGVRTNTADSPLRWANDKEEKKKNRRLPKREQLFNTL